MQEQTLLILIALQLLGIASCVPLTQDVDRSPAIDVQLIRQVNEDVSATWCVFLGSDIPLSPTISRELTIVAA